jgi:GntR family transcriptional regulator/MocR family aminotransferase
VATNRTNYVTGLLLELPDDGRALHSRLTSAIKAAIVAGRLTSGHLLPPSRVLAADLGCSRWVVNEAYAQLAAEGHLQTLQGSGTRVAPVTAATREPGRPASSRPALVAPPVVADLRPGAPDVTNFPTAPWTRALQHVLTAADWSPPVFAPPQGVLRARQLIADYLGRVRGLPVEADEVLLTCGTSHGMAVAARVLAARGALRLAVEDPGWPRLHQVASAAGLRIEPVAVDTEGLNVDALRRTDTQVVLCAPAHQFPTGTVLSAARRRALLAWATECSAMIIEDDYDAEFRYDRRPVGALAGLDRDHVIYLGSTSKTLHPGLRLGWLVPPPELRRPMLDALDSSAAGPSSLDQLTFARLIDVGDYDRHLRRTRTAYRIRRDALVDALDRHPALHDCGPAHGVAAGLQLMFPLPHGRDDHTVAALLADRGIAVAPLSRYTVRPRPPALVMGYSRLTPTRAAWTADQLATTLADMEVDR